MSLEMRQESVTPGSLDEHGRISIAFMVDRILEVAFADGGTGGMSLTETRVAGACQDGTRVGGAVLFRAAEDWAAARGCGWLKIETQNVNAAACRFYQKMGCTLGGIDRFAYPELPREVQLLWWKALQPPQ
jgi:ribosomal protein S18 acetylase RimI-like enzyme